MITFAPFPEVQRRKPRRRSGLPLLPLLLALAATSGAVLIWFFRP